MVMGGWLCSSAVREWEDAKGTGADSMVDACPALPSLPRLYIHRRQLEKNYGRASGSTDQL